MEKEKTVSVQKMKETLAEEVGARFPVKIMLKNGEQKIWYVRGFADQQSNVLLVSENSYNLALKIIEVKDIRTIEYAPEHSMETWKVLHAKK